MKNIFLIFFYVSVLYLYGHDPKKGSISQPIFVTTNVLEGDFGKSRPKK